MSRRAPAAIPGLVVLGAVLALSGAACGDVTSDLISDSSGTSGSGNSSGAAGSGSSLGGTTASGGTSPGGSSGSSSGGTSPGGSGSGGAATGGGSGSGGAPGCTTSDDCTSSDRRICDLTKHECVECTAGSQCGTDEDCSSELGECARPCTSADQCIEEDDRFCDAIGFCVECQQDADCDSNVCSLWKCR